MATYSEKQPTTDVEGQSLDRSSDSEHEAVTGETYVLESANRNALWKWAFYLDEKVSLFQLQTASGVRLMNDPDWHRSPWDGTYPTHTTDHRYSIL